MNNKELTEIIINRKKLKARKRAQYKKAMKTLLDAAKAVTISTTSSEEFSIHIAAFVTAAQKLAPKHRPLWLDLEDIRLVAENVLRDFE